MRNKKVNVKGIVAVIIVIVVISGITIYFSTKEDCEMIKKGKYTFMSHQDWFENRCKHPIEYFVIVEGIEVGEISEEELGCLTNYLDTLNFDSFAFHSINYYENKYFDVHLNLTPC